MLLDFKQIKKLLKQDNTNLPVVATKVGGIPYVVVDGKSGLLCQYAHVDAMADMAYRLMTDEALWKQYSVAAREIAKDFNWTAIAEKIVKLYNA